MKHGSKWAAAALALLILSDVTLVVLHVAFGWSVINLDEESNLAAWYSSAKLLALAGFACTIWNTERRSKPGRLTVLWLAVALVFLGLSMDETACLHERLARAVMEESSVGLDIRETVLDGDATKDSFAWVLILSPLVVATAVFLLLFFYSRFFPPRAGYIPATIALILFVSAVALESTIYFLPAFDQWTAADLARYKFFIAIEESGELVGSTLFLFAFFRYARHLRSRADAGQETATCRSS